MRRLAGTSIGKGERFYNTINAVRPSKDEWEKSCTRPGGLGGFKGEIVDTEDIVHKQATCLPQLKELDMNIKQAALRDYKTTKWKLGRSMKRRAAPGWSAPVELFQIITLTGYLSKPKHAVAGIGVQDSRTQGESTKAQAAL